MITSGFVTAVSAVLLTGDQTTILMTRILTPYPPPTSQIRRRFTLERIKLTARVANIHAIFLLTVRRIRMFFSLKPPLPQGKSSQKISAHQV